MSAVPCNGCTRCCHGDAVRLLPHEDLTQYQVEAHPYFSGAYMPSKPQQCREMDCRLLGAMTFTHARKLAKRRGLPLRVWRKGRELLRGGAER